MIPWPKDDYGQFYSGCAPHDALRPCGLACHPFALLVPPPSLPPPQPSVPSFSRIAESGGGVGARPHLPTPPLACSHSTRSFAVRLPPTCAVGSDAYIILQTTQALAPTKAAGSTAPKRGHFVYRIFFWLGLETSMDKQVS